MVNQKGNCFLNLYTLVLYPYIVITLSGRMINYLFLSLYCPTLLKGIV